MTVPPTLAALLARAAERGGSDLHVTAGVPPQIRLNGALEPQKDLAPLAPDDARRLIYGGLTAAQRQRFEELRELDVSFGIERGEYLLVQGPSGSAARWRPCTV